MAPYECIVAIYRVVPSRRLEDRIRELCAKVTLVHGSELNTALDELKTALNEHSKKVRKIAAEGLLSEYSRPERRKR
jgi:transcription elongation factor GreA-like protein